MMILKALLECFAMLTEKNFEDINGYNEDVIFPVTKRTFKKVSSV
ncbi:hypothetical protein ACQWU4_02875 [Chryseobacterium sp. MIQD13]